MVAGVVDFLQHDLAGLHVVHLQPAGHRGDDGKDQTERVAQRGAEVLQHLLRAVGVCRKHLGGIDREVDGGADQHLLAVIDGREGQRGVDHRHTGWAGEDGVLALQGKDERADIIPLQQGEDIVLAAQKWVMFFQILVFPALQQLLVHQSDGEWEAVRGLHQGR